MNDEDEDLIRRAWALPREEPSANLRDSVLDRARAETRRAARTRGFVAVILAIASVTLGAREDRRVVRLVAGHPPTVAPASKELGLGAQVFAIQARARARAQWNLALQLGRLENSS